MNDYINGLTNSVMSQLLFIKKLSHDIALKIKTKYTSFIFLLPLLKCIYVNPFLVVLFTLFIGHRRTTAWRICALLPKTPLVTFPCLENT